MVPENPYISGHIDPLPSVLPDWDEPGTVAEFLAALPDQTDLCPSKVSELISRMGMRFHLLNPKVFVMSMPVEGNRQPQGVVHGGANAALAESAGSIAANYLAPEGKLAVGANIYVNHHRPGTGERIYAVAINLQAGRTLATYEIRLFNDHGQLTASGMHTVAFV